MYFEDRNFDDNYLLAYCLSYNIIQLIEKDDRYEYCKNTLFDCIKWFYNRDYDLEVLYENFSNENYDLCTIMDEIEEERLSNKFGCILSCVGFMTNSAFNCCKITYPEDLEGYDCEYMNEVIDYLIQEGEITQYRIERFVEFISNNRLNEDTINREIDKIIICSEET